MTDRVETNISIETQIEELEKQVQAAQDGYKNLEDMELIFKGAITKDSMKLKKSESDIERILKQITELEKEQNGMKIELDNIQIIFEKETQEIAEYRERMKMATNQYDTKNN